jgi:hypothetical protein
LIAAATLLDPLEEFVRVLRIPSEELVELDEVTSRAGAVGEELVTEKNAALPVPLVVV